MSSPTGIPPLGDERGFTLIELLVAMAGATVVVTAALAIYIVALHQTTRISDREQADQFGRTAMSQIVEELHSSCLQKEFVPVQEASTPAKLVFRDAASNEAQISSSKAKAEAYEDRIVWTKVKGSEGTLVDERYPVESGALPKEFKFNETTPSAKITLATNISRSKNAEGKELPFFTYSEYAGKASAGNETQGVNALKEISVKEGETLSAKAAKVAAVEINFTIVDREENGFQTKQKAAFSNEVIFAFGLPASEATFEQKPCQ